MDILQCCSVLADQLNQEDVNPIGLPSIRTGRRDEPGYDLGAGRHGEAASLATIWLHGIATDKGARRYGHEALSAQSSPCPSVFPLLGRRTPAHRRLGRSAQQRRGATTTASGTFLSWRQPQRLFPTPVVGWLPPAPPEARQTYRDLGPSRTGASQLSWVRSVAPEASTSHLSHVQRPVLTLMVWSAPDG